MDDYLNYIENAYKNNIIDYETYLASLKYVQRLLENSLPIIFNLRHIRKIFQISKSDQDIYFGNKRDYNYRVFYIPKKDNSWRTIEAPIDHLKTIQEWIKTNILEKIAVSDYAKGFKKNNSIIDNAKEHINKKLVFNIDLKDFFPSITYNRVYRIFKYVGYTNEVSHLLTKLCTNSKNILPQGSPASPLISNIVCLKLDKRLSKLAQSMHCDYTRYADDITISGSKTLCKHIPLIRKIIAEEGFLINDKKVRLQTSAQQQSVTGLIVNKKLSVDKKLERELKNTIYYAKKYGISDHLKHINCTKTFYKEHIYGIAYFINMVDKNKGQKYLKELDDLQWPY